MRKKLLKLSFVAAVAIAAGYTAYNSQKTETLSDLTMDNVEALASGENPFCPNGCKLNGPGCLCDGLQCNIKSVGKWRFYSIDL